MSFLYALNMKMPEFENQVNFKNKLIFSGSCFSENIGFKLKNLGFDVCNSANGIVFNGISMAYPFHKSLEQSKFDENDLLFHNGVWHGKYHHGVYSHHDSSICVQKMNDDLSQLAINLEKASHLFFTFGSSFAYFYENDEQPVANCHKIPQSHFKKRLLDIQTQTAYWDNLLNLIHQQFPNLKIVLTVSPVKHLKDGVSENLLSKSILILLCHTLKNKFSFVEYFPSYELLSEDLRDYRFYDSDAAHPNEIAKEYIFEKFILSLLDAESIEFAKQMKALNNLKSHRMLSDNPNEINKHLNAMNKLQSEIESKFKLSLK